MQLSYYFEPYLAYISAKGRTQKTVHEHRRFLVGPITEAVGGKDLMELRKVDSALIESAGRRYGEYGAQRSIVTLRRLLNYIEDRGEETPFSWRDLQLPKVPRRIAESLEKDELEGVMASFNTATTIGLRTRVLYEFMFTAGLRISEALNIKGNDIDIEKKEIHIINAKTKEQEIVYLTDRCLYWLKEYLNRRTDIYDYIFTSTYGKLSPGAARRNLQAFTKGLGIKKHLKPHLFRKTFTTTLLREKVNIKDVQHLSRHKSERTTLRYYAAVNFASAKLEHQRVMDVFVAPVMPTPSVDTVEVTNYTTPIITPLWEENAMKNVMRNWSNGTKPVGVLANLANTTA